MKLIRTDSHVFSLGPRTLVDLPASDLQKPLGTPRASKPARQWPRQLSYGLAAIPALLISGSGLYVALFGNPVAGMPKAVAVITMPSAAPVSPQGQQAFNFSAQDAAQPAPAERTETTAGQMEQDAGVRVMRPGGADTPNSVIIRVPDANLVKLAAAPDRRLIERGRHGSLPRVGEDGVRAFQIYARPVPAASAQAPVKIAIMVGGMGISASATQDAVAKLPGEISLAFAPYGGDLERNVQRARADGHEVFLQLPMEPFDYPDNDPGPHTMTTTRGAEDNLDRLRWVMSRFAGYVGVVNFMGGRLMADEAALSPVLREVAERGLMVVDDGSSGRSVMSQVASGFRTPAVRADMVLDLVQRTDAIDRELARLEQQAKARGFAMATASALPLSIERINRWARTLEARGIKLVPVSHMAAGKGQITGSVR